MKEEIVTGHAAYAKRLKSGESISFRSYGNSMTPIIKSGMKCTYSPVLEAKDIKVGDAVFCRIGKFYYTHLITNIQQKGENTLYQISNNHGRVNGQITISQIFGKVIKTEK